LELAFDSKSLRTICENESKAIEEFGPKVANALKHRLADIRSATSYRDLLAGDPRVVDHPNGERLVINLCDGYRMIVRPNHPNNPKTDFGTISWPKVSRVKIIQIEN
jgi:plasmid maintenance system killer protein